MASSTTALFPASLLKIAVASWHTECLRKYEKPWSNMSKDACGIRLKQIVKLMNDKHKPGQNFKHVMY